MVLYPNKLPESERVCSGICSKITGIKKLIKITHSDEWLREIKSEQYKIY